MLWKLQPRPDRSGASNTRSVLFAESYASGSHLQVANLLQRYARHQIDILTIPRNHWRTLALSGHRTLGDAFASLSHQEYDLLVLSGPADIRLVKSRMPPEWTQTPIAVYVHESQWTYPASSLDRIPHLFSHLEMLELCDAAWFNSDFHRQTFFDSAWDHPSKPVRALAREILPDHWCKAGVLYPPLDAPRTEPVPRSGPLRITWSARWEQEKRPDLMIAIMRTLQSDGVEFVLQILGCDPDRWRSEISAGDTLRTRIDARSGYLDRNSYQEALARSDIWLSTAEHEFFGISALEAILAGATPVVPAALAYAETMPSAVTYPHGNVQAAARRIAALGVGPAPEIGAWKLDAARYLAARTIPRFDQAIDRVINASRSQR